MAVDLPALLRPTKAISGSSVGGNWSSLDAVVRNRAVCVHASAVLAALVDAGLSAGLAKGYSSVIVKSWVCLPNPSSSSKVSHMKSPLAAAAIALCAPVLASDAKPAAKADLAKGRGDRDPGLRGLPQLRRLAWTVGQPDPARPTPRVPGQAAHRLQIRLAQQRHHEGLCQHAEPRRHEERGRVLCVEDRKARLRHQTRIRWRWANESTAAASPIARSPHARAVTAPTGQAFPCSTRA